MAAATFAAALSSCDRLDLPNGLRILVREDHEVPIVAANIWVHAGVAHESPEHNGIAHFFEHMFFKGTETRAPGDMDREITALGGYNNASTSFDFTQYYVVLPSPHWREALGILTDALLHSTFPREELEREREVVFEEITQREDDPFSMLFTLFQERVFRGVPYERPILGTEESLARISRDDLFSWARELYTPERFVLTVCGDVRPEELFREAESLFGPLARGANAGPAWSFTPGAPSDPLVLPRDTQQKYLILGFPTGDIGGRRDEYALDVGSAILGEGRASRLYRRLREDAGLVSSLDVGFAAYERAGLFSIEAAYDAADAPRVEGILEEELDRIRQGDFRDDELHRAKTLIVTGFRMGLERCSSIAGTLGHYELLGRLEEAFRYPANILNVGREDVVECFRAHCPAERMSRGEVVPRS